MSYEQNTIHGRSLMKIGKLESELAKANAEAETWKRHHDALDKVCEVYKEDIEKLKERLAECEKVVAFYADEDSWGENQEDKYLYNILRVEDFWREKVGLVEFKTGGKRARDYQSKYGAKDYSF